MTRRSKGAIVCAMRCRADNFCAALGSKDFHEFRVRSKRSVMRRGDVVPPDVIAQFPILCISGGILAVRHVQANGNVTIAALCSTGDIIDLRGAPPDMPFSFAALGAVRLCHIEAELFDQIVTTNPRARKIAWRSLQQQAFRAMTQHAEMAKKSSLQRLAWFVAEFFSGISDDAAEPRTNVFRMPLRHCDLAAFLGQQPETVSRGFHELSAQGILHLDGPSVIQIIDPEKLDQLAYGRLAAD